MKKNETLFCLNGYDIICKLTINAAEYHIVFDNYFSATGAIYRFCDELR